VTVLAKRGGWPGRHGRRHPNRVLHWTVIKWAKAQGYRHYDFEGIDLRAARAIVHGKPLPDSLQQTPTSFKLGFGGQVTLFSEAYDYVYNPFLRWAYNTVSPKIACWSVMKNAADRLRTG